jgi:hypothetical protein
MRCSRGRNAACSESAERCKVSVMSGAGSRGPHLDPPQSAAVVSVDEKSHLLLQPRPRVLNYQLASDFHRWYPGLSRTPDPIPLAA